MLKKHHPELVFIASPWQYHVQHALLCVEHGCHVALEVKGGLCLDEYAPLIESAERRGCHVYPLENTLFTRENLAVFNMVNEGLLGEIVFMRGGYRHDLRRLLLDDAGNIGNREKTESVWRGKYYLEENGDLYPTHGLAPLCMIAGINRKDRIKYLTSFSSKSAGMLQRIKELGGNTDVKVCMGDVIVTQLETEGGIIISLVHDTTLPRPRSLDFEIQGTKAIWQGLISLDDLLLLLINLKKANHQFLEVGQLQDVLIPLFHYYHPSFLLLHQVHLEEAHILYSLHSQVHVVCYSLYDLKNYSLQLLNLKLTMAFLA
jgi:predicted dehydrogenase